MSAIIKSLLNYISQLRHYIYHWSLIRGFTIFILLLRHTTYRIIVLENLQTQSQTFSRTLTV
jgi:hypothetical protein